MTSYNISNWFLLKSSKLKQYLLLSLQMPNLFYTNIQNAISKSKG